MCYRIVEGRVVCSCIYVHKETRRGEPSLHNSRVLASQLRNCAAASSSLSLCSLSSSPWPNGEKASFQFGLFGGFAFLVREEARKALKKHSFKNNESSLLNI